MRILLSFLLLVSLAGHAQDDKARLDEAAGKIVSGLREADNVEILVHTDKEWYPLGSTLWFRVYLVKAFSKLPAASARVYVDLVDQNDSLVSRTMLNSASHEWDGGIRIGSQWKKGLYRMRIFTEEMLLSPAIGKPLEKPLYFFSRSDKDPAPVAAFQKPVPGIAFSPEGGSLINGLPNVIALRSFDKNGDPVSSSGYVRDNRNEIVETFKLNGYGKFSFSPSKNRKYRMFLEMPDKTEQSFDLPLAANDAWQISVTKSTANSVTLRVAQGDSLYTLKPVSYLVGVSRTRLLFASVGRGVYEVNVPLKDFPAGPAMFYLLNEKQEVVSTRQLTIRNENTDLKVIPNKQSYAPRETVLVDLDLKDGSGQPVQALLSVSVTDDRYMPVIAGADAGGPAEITDIVEPVSFIPAKAMPVKDSLMRVSGTVSISGDSPGGKLVSLVSTADNLLLTDTADVDGRFRFQTPEFYDGKPFMIQVSDARGSKLPALVITEPEKFTVEKQKWETKPASEDPIVRYVTNQADSFLNGVTRKHIEALEAGISKQKGNRKANDSRNKFSRMITGEQLDKLQLGTTANAVMMVPGVIMMEGKLTIRGGLMGLSSGLSGIEPLIIIDGVPAGSTNVIDIINSIPPYLIDYIEVLTGGDAGMYGTRGANGVILIKTNTGPRDQRARTQEGLQYVYPPGYHQVPEFFMPKYEIPQVRSYPFIDNRSTIFWKGEVLTDRSGKAKFSFYAADEPTTYTIRVVGVGSKGDIIDKRVQIRR